MSQANLIEKTKREHISKWIGLKNGNVVVVSDTQTIYTEN